MSQGGSNLPDGFYSVAMASSRTGISSPTLRRWDKSEKFKARRITQGKSEYRYYTEFDLALLNVLKNQEYHFHNQRLDELRGL